MDIAGAGEDGSRGRSATNCCLSLLLMQIVAFVEAFGNGIIIILQINLKIGVKPEKERI